MAGITAMGDLSHELESLVNFIDSGGTAPTAEAFDVLQASVDELARMRDSVAAGRGVAPARECIARIRALLNPGQAAAPAAGVAAAPAAPLEVPAPPSVPEVPDAPHAPEVPQAPQELPNWPPPQVPQYEPPTAPPQAPVGFESLTEAAFELPQELELAPSEPPPAPLQEFPPLPGTVPAALPVMTDLAPAPPQLVPPGREPVAPGDRPEMARVDAELLDQLLNVSGEVSISRARLEQQMGSIEFNLAELSRTVTRLKEQQRKLEIETEKQILHGHEEETGHRAEFDPLELDRYSAIQQFSRGLAETASDVASIQQLLESLVQETQNLLQQQARPSPSCRTA